MRQRGYMVAPAASLAVVKRLRVSTALRLVLFLTLSLPSLTSAQAGAGSAPSLQALDVLVAEAREATRTARWPEGWAAWQRVIDQNPYMAEAWFRLAAASERVGDDTAALRAYTTYLASGGGPPVFRTLFGPDAPPEVAYTIASIHARAGQRDSALVWIRRALDMGLRNRSRVAADSTFAGLRNHPRFTDLGTPVRAATRTAGRRDDVKYLREEVHRSHAGVKRVPAAFDSAAERLVAGMSTLSENGFVVGVQRVLTLVGDAHTTLVPEGIPAWNRTLPVMFESYADSIFIVAADSLHRDLVGARITHVAQQPMAGVLIRLDSLASRDNSQGVLRTRVRNLRFPQMLHGLGMIPTDSMVTWSVVLSNGVRKVVNVTTRRTPAQYHRFAGDPSWVTLESRRPGPIPLARRDLRSSYWFTYLPESRTVYFAFNSVVNDPTESLAQFASRLLRHVDSTKAERLVVDLRANNGGNSRLLQPLTDGIAASRVNRPGALYVLAGRYTYSAGMNAAAFLERHTSAVFVGEPTPSSPNFVGESNLFLLPNSALPVSVSDVYWQSSWPFDFRNWIAPQHYLPPTRGALENLRDPALEAVLNTPLPPARISP